jgi:hypothetical protein
MVHNGWIESFGTKCFSIFDPLENILDERKTREWNQNVVLFPNMGSEIVCLFLAERSGVIFERPKKIVWTDIFFLDFRIFTISVRK